jgi:hypothetical protein
MLELGGPLWYGKGDVSLVNCGYPILASHIYYVVIFFI